MIVMTSFIVARVSQADELAAEYAPARVGSYDLQIPASIWVHLLNDGERTGGDLNISIEHARVLAESLTQLVLLHDAAERLAAEMAIDVEAAPVPMGKAQRKQLGLESGRAVA